MYPTNIRQIFKAAMADLNDDERGVIRIKFTLAENIYPKIG